VKGFKGLAVPPCPTPPQLDEWMTESLNRLVALLKEHTPVSRPSHHSKPWWTPHLSILRREYHKAATAARKHHSPQRREVAGTSKSGYFKAIKAAKTKSGPPFCWPPPPRAFGRPRGSPTAAPSRASPPSQGPRPHNKWTMSF